MGVSRSITDNHIIIIFFSSHGNSNLADQSFTQSSFSLLSSWSGLFHSLHVSSNTTILYHNPPPFCQKYHSKVVVIACVCISVI
uniref:Uncharacterized protein n=1 Tax=Arion vulgaris TaxID=1028688 RepID=A0A0B6ZR92_9EUPU